MIYKVYINDLGKPKEFIGNAYSLEDAKFLAHFETNYRFNRNMYHVDHLGHSDTMHSLADYLAVTVPVPKWLEKTSGVWVAHLDTGGTITTSAPNLFIEAEAE